MKNLISLILSLVFISQEVSAVLPEHDDLRGRPSMVQLTPEQMNEVMKNPTYKVKHVLLAQNQEAEEQVKEEIEKEKKRKEKEDEEEPDYKKEGGNYGGGVGLFAGLGIGGANSLVVAFAVVGVFLVVAWIVAFPVMAFRAISGRKDYKMHSLLGVQYSRFTESSRKDGELTGLRYSLFLTEPEAGLLNSNLGVAAETGHYDFDRDGPYWMVGPSFMYGFEMGTQMAFWKLDTLAGSSFNSDYGLASKVDGSFNIEIAKHLSFGIGIGAVYLDRNHNESELNDPEGLRFMYGGNLTWLF